MLPKDHAGHIAGRCEDQAAGVFIIFPQEKRMRRVLLSAAILAGVFFAGTGFAQSLEESLASASRDAGEQLYRQCRACHTIESGGRNMVGPNLYGIVGDAVASREDVRYSNALAEIGGEWTPEQLSAFLEDPRAFAPGTRMAFRGLKDIEDRAAIIAYLNSQSDAPLDFGGG